MKDTREHREEREAIVIKCVHDLGVLYGIGTAPYEIEMWTKDDTDPVIEGKSGIRITMSWEEK